MTTNPVADAMTIALTLRKAAGEEPVLYGCHPTHDFSGIDGRCMWCDCRPYGIHAPHRCPCAPKTCDHEVADGNRDDPSSAYCYLRPGHAGPHAYAP